MIDDTLFAEDDFLLLSGIQHMAFCERQWALIHMEQMWEENVRTTEGKHLHERVDDVFFDESRGRIRMVRSMPIVSYRLRLRGIADVVEFRRSETKIEDLTCRLEGRKGWWQPAPIEYKRGKPKIDDRDKVQLCAQVMALEEMMKVIITEAAIYYAQTRRRQPVEMNSKLREHTVQLAERMHNMAREGTTPKAPKGRRCSQCSLVEKCQPKLTLRRRSVENYLKKMYITIEEEEKCL